jgi:hypothetical protein
LEGLNFHPYSKLNKKGNLAPPILSGFIAPKLALKGENLLPKIEHSFRGSNNFTASIGFIDKSFMRASLICLLRAFNVFLFDG